MGRPVGIGELAKEHSSAEGYAPATGRRGTGATRCWGPHATDRHPVAGRESPADGCGGTVRAGVVGDTAGGGAPDPRAVHS